jgi:PadR family transcriptional regulator, regulatory protein PadR
MEVNIDKYLITKYFRVELRHEADGGMTMSPKPDVLQGTLDLMVLKTLEGLGPAHGYGIARRIEQVAGKADLTQGTIYPALVRLEERGWISSSWGASENNRRARYYELTKLGRKQIAKETEHWYRVRAMMDQFLEDTYDK